MVPVVAGGGGDVAGGGGGVSVAFFLADFLCVSTFGSLNMVLF